MEIFINDLLKFDSNLREIRDLEDEIGVLEFEMEYLDELIETSGNDDEIEVLTEKYNKANLERIQKALRKNRLEKEALMFELDEATAE